MTENNWFEIENIDQLDSPALVIYPDRVKENIRILKSMIDDPIRLRPHIKTHKTKEATLLQMEAGIQKFKCATIAEAEVLGMCKAQDVLLAYPPIGPKLLRFVSLIKKYSETKFSCLVDNIPAAKQMADVFVSNEIIVPLFIDLNVGMNRTGIEAGDAALQLYMDCSQRKGIQPVGLHMYDGHIHDTDYKIRKKRCDEGFIPAEKMKNKLKEMGFAEPIIIAGGSPTFPIHSKRKDIQCSPGTFIYWDKGYLDTCPEQSFLPAALVITRVISLPAESKICLDLGHKSIAPENELTRRVHFINAPELKAVSQSEEHLVVETHKDHKYGPGDVLYGMPIHICPTVALHERAFTIENGKITGEWKTIARDRRIST